MSVIFVKNQTVLSKLLLGHKSILFSLLDLTTQKNEVFL